MRNHKWLKRVLDVYISDHQELTKRRSWWASVIGCACVHAMQPIQCMKYSSEKWKIIMPWTKTQLTKERKLILTRVPRCQNISIKIALLRRSTRHLWPKYSVILPVSGLGSAGVTMTWDEYGKYSSQQWRILHIWINTLKPRQDGRYFADDVLKCIFLNENVGISLKIPLKFVSRFPINNIPALVQIMAWRRPGDKSLSEPMLVFVPTHICVTRPQWVKLEVFPASPYISTEYSQNT